MKHFNIEPQEHTSALEDISSAVALEALSVSSIVNRIVDLVPALTQAGKTFLSKTNKDKPTLQPMSYSASVLAKALEPAAYMRIGSLSHPVPPGFRGNLYEYAKLIHDSLEFANTTPAKLTAFNIFLSKIISSPDERKSIRNVADEYRKEDKVREAFLALAKPYFNAGSRINYAKYEDIIASNGQYLQYCALVAQTIELSANVDFNTVQKLVTDAQELLQSVSQESGKGKMNEMSPETLQHLSAATLSVAKSVEFYSMCLWSLSHLRQCTQEGATAMIRALRY